MENQLYVILMNNKYTVGEGKTFTKEDARSYVKTAKKVDKNNNMHVEYKIIKAN